MAEVNGKVVIVPDWDQYFLGIAEAVSARAKCTRRCLLYTSPSPRDS